MHGVKCYRQRHKRCTARCWACAGCSSIVVLVVWWWVDGGAALMLVLLAAVDEGLGAGFLGAHDLPELGPMLGVPDDVEVMGIVTIGHPTDEQPPSSASRGRRAADEVVRREEW